MNPPEFTPSNSTPTLEERFVGLKACLETFLSKTQALLGMSRDEIDTILSGIDERQGILDELEKLEFNATRPLLPEPQQAELTALVEQIQALESPLDNHLYRILSGIADDLKTSQTSSKAISSYQQTNLPSQLWDEWYTEDPN